jgi:hypothetical protein
MPASTSAMWRTATGEPFRESLPAIFIKQPRSPASTVGAPLSTMFCALLYDRAGDVAVFDREGAPEAAAYLGFIHLDEREALYAAQKPPRLRLDAEFAQARAGVVVGDTPS